MKKITTYLLTLLMIVTASAQKTWTGIAGDGQWSSPTNWSGNTTPVPTDNVLLDNSVVAGSYTVTLPTGATSTLINQLTITPTGANNITLVLPATNTAAPGFKVGDGVAGNYDIILNSGAILKNSSAATTGNGIETGSLTLDSIKISNGARYTHNSLRSTAGTVPVLAKAPGTETGIYEYDSPGTASVSASESGRTYGSLVFTRTAGAATYTASGGSAVTIRGSLVINAGVTYTSTMTGAMNLAGDFTNNGVAFSTTQNININGTNGVQTISGTGTFTFGTTAAMTIAAGSTAATGQTLTFNGPVAVNGAFQINQGGFASGTGVWIYTNGKLVFNNSTGSYGVNNDVYWPSTNGPTDVTVQNTGGITLNVARTVTGIFQTSAGVTNANNLSLNGTAKINTGGYFAGSPTYGTGSTLVYNTGGTYGRGQEWNATTGAGYPFNVQVSNSTILDVGSASPGTALQTAGNLTIDAGSAFYMDYGGNFMTQPVTILGNLLLNGNLSLSQSVGGDLKLAGNWTHNSGFFAPQGRAVFFNGTTDQTLTATGGETFDYAIVDKSAGNLVLASNATFNQILTLTNGKIATGSNKVIIGGSSPVSRTNGWVNGNLQKNIATGASTTNFEIGDVSNYTPVSVNFANVLIQGNLVARTTGADHPQIATSGLDASKDANRYWTVTNTGITFTTYSITLNFVPSDLDAGSVPTTFKVAKYDAGAWTLPTTSSATATSTTATGLTSFSDFATGNLSALPIAVEYLHGLKQSNGNLLEWKVGCGGSPYAVLSLERGSNGIDFASVYQLTATSFQCQQQFDHIDQPAPGINYYRLKMSDEYGQIIYSPVVSILNKDAGFSVKGIYPRVASSILSIHSDKDNSVQVVVTDMQGRVVLRSSSSISAGDSQVNLDLSKLSRGVYSVGAITTSGENATVRFVKE